MADNVTVSSAASYGVASDEVTYSGDASQKLQLFRPVHVAGAEGSKTVTDLTDAYGRMQVTQYDADLLLSPGMTPLRDLLTAERYTVAQDSLADGIGIYWTQTAASGGTFTSTVGEGQLKTSTAATGSMIAVSPTVDYFPGQVAWFNSAIRTGDTGVAGDIRRWGPFTQSAGTPQEGFYYELSGTTLNAVYVKAGSATATAAASWSKASTAPFTLDANFHSWEIRYTANSVWFYIDNVLRHVVSGTTTPLTTTLNFPITLQNTKTSGATDITLGVRNVGLGRFGQKPSNTVQTTTATVAGAATNTTLLAANWARKGAAVVNDSGAILYLKCGATSSTTDYTVKMFPDAYFEVPFGYLGIITGTWASATGNARITEFS